MGLVLTASGANFELNAVSFIPPVEDGLLYWMYPNDSREKLGRNFAPNGTPGVVEGQPAVDSHGAVLDDNNYVNTGLQQTHSLTYIAVGNPVADGAELGMYISNYAGARPGGMAGYSFGASLYCHWDTPGDGVYQARASVARFSGESGSTSGLNYVAFSDLDVAKPAFLAMTYDGTEKVVRGYNLSTGEYGERPSIPDFTDIAATPVYIGACPGDAWVSLPKHMHFAAIYNRKLSESELGMIYARVKAYLAERNVNI